MKLTFKSLLEKKLPGAEYFDDHALQRAEYQNEKSREILIYASPDWFLKMAKTISATDTRKYTSINTALENGVKLNDIPFLELDNDGTKAFIFSHDGRHRAMGLKHLGVNLMPIVIKARRIRWGCQNNPNMKSDYEEEWPTKLITENGDELPFPFSRDIYFKDAKDRLNVNIISESIKLPSYFITDIEELKEVLAEFKIKNYTINDDLTVDVNDSVSMKNNDFFFKFGVVDGDFIVGRFWRTR